MKKIKRSNGKKAIALTLCLLGIGSVSFIGINKIMKANIVEQVKKEEVLPNNQEENTEIVAKKDDDFTNNSINNNWEEEATKLVQTQEESKQKEFEEQKENTAQIKNLKQDLSDLEKDNSLTKQEKEEKAKLINEQIEAINKNFQERQKEFEEKRKLVQLQEQKLKQAIEEQEAKLKQIKEEQEKREAELKQKHEEELRELEKQKESLFSLENKKEESKSEDVEDLAKGIKDIDFNNLIETSKEEKADKKTENVLIEKQDNTGETLTKNNDLKTEEQKKLNSTTIKQVKTEWLPLTIYKNSHKYNKYGTWLEVKMRNRI